MKKHMMRQLSIQFKNLCLKYADGISSGNCKTCTGLPLCKGSQTESTFLIVETLEITIDIVETMIGQIIERVEV